MVALDKQFAAAQVFVDGQPAAEFDNDDEAEVDTENSVTKYVEAVSGKEFSFCFTIKPQFDWKLANAVLGEAFTEGRRVGGRFVRKPTNFPLNDISMRISGNWSGSGVHAVSHKYVFSDLETRKRVLSCQGLALT
jgi:hypothetical protein